MATRTKGYALKHGARPAKQKGYAAAVDGWGGSGNPVLGANDQYIFDELKISDSPEWFVDNSINQTQLESSQTVTMLKADVSAKMKVWTEGSSALLASALGWDTLAGPITAGALKNHLVAFNPYGKDYRDWTTAEQAKFLVAYAAGDEYNLGLYHFLASEGPADLLCKNALIDSCTLSCAQKQPLMLDFTAVGEKVIRDASKTQSPNLTVASPKFQSFFTMKDCTISKIGATYGGLIDAQFMDFSVKVQHGIVKDVATTKSGVYRSYPVSDGETKLTFDATVFIHDTEQWKTWEQAGTSLLVKLGFTKGTNTFTIFITNLQLSTVTVDYGGGGTVKLSGVIYQAPAVDPFAAEHTGLTLDFPTPLYVSVVDSETNNLSHMITT